MQLRENQHCINRLCVGPSKVIDEQSVDDASSCSSDKVYGDSYGPDEGGGVGSNGLSIAFYPGGVIEVMNELQPERTVADKIKSRHQQHWLQMSPCQEPLIEYLKDTDFVLRIFVSLER